MADGTLLRGRVTIMAGQALVHNRQQGMGQLNAGCYAFVTLAAFQTQVFNVQDMGENDTIGSLLCIWPGVSRPHRGQQQGYEKTITHSSRAIRYGRLV